MSLSLEPIDSNSKHIASVYENKDFSKKNHHSSLQHFLSEFPKSKVKLIKKIYLNDNDFSFDGENKSNGIKKIVMENEYQFILPHIKDYTDGDNERIFICGKSGCGKTFYSIRPYIIQWKSKHPTSKIYFFSSKAEDKAVDDLPIQRIIIDDKFVANPPDIRTFTNPNGKPNLVIFDDIQDYKKKSFNNVVQQLRDEIARNGRSLGLFVLYLWHKPADRANTEIQIFESTATVIFPKTSGHDDYDYLAQRYLGIKSDKLNILKKAKSNYVYITRKNPAVAISDKYIMVL